MTLRPFKNWTWIVLIIATSVEEKGNVESKCGERWNGIEFQNLLYQRRNCRDQTQRAQLSKTIRKFLRANMREKRTHRVSKISQDFQNLGEMEAIRFEPLRPCKKTVSVKHHVRFLSDIFLLCR
jgi:hypothetical protein